MKILTVRLPDPLAADIEAESRARKISRSDIVRERLQRPRGSASAADPLTDIADLIGSVDGLPPDLSARHGHYLTTSGYGQKRRR
jgi:hypothetical protein